MTDHSDLIADAMKRHLRISIDQDWDGMKYAILGIDEAAKEIEALSSQSLSLSEAREEIERLKGLVAGIRETPQEPSSVETLLSPDDIKLEVWPYGKSPGGQQCGTHPGVRVVHIPSNTVATVECAGSQHRNKEIALEMILAAITHPRFRP